MHERAAAELRGANDIIILTHRRPDGDTVGCAAALCRALRQLGKAAWVLPNEDISSLFSPYLEGLLAPEGVTGAYVVAVDTASAALLPPGAAPYAGRVDLALDHHGSNEGYARVNVVDPSCAACGELIYRVILALGAQLTPEIALPLYVAVATDTGCFVYANTTPATHRVAAALMDVGIDYVGVNKRHFRTKSDKRLRMESQMIARMRRSHGGLVALVSIPLALMQEIGAGEEDVEDIAAFLGLMEGVRVSATVRELAAGECKISLRTTPEVVSAARVCALLGGGGHPAAGGCTVFGTVAEAEAAILDAIDRCLPPDGGRA